MSEIPDFSDQDAAEAWFETQPREVGISVAARSSLRVLPTVLGEFAPKLAAKDILIWRLACFRATLVSAAAAVCSAAETERVEQLRSAASSAAAFSASARAAFSGARSATSHDAKTAAASIGPAFRSALWPDTSDVPELVAAWHSFRDADPSDPVWDFWLRWYQGMWDGKPLDWELTTQVALIPDDVWEDGAKAVAEAIVRIELEFRIAELERDIARSYGETRAGVGHNNPPSEITDILDVLKAEAASPTPSAARVLHAIAKLKSALKACVDYAAKKADLVVDTAIKWGVPAAGGFWLATNPKAIQNVIDAAEKLLQIAGP